MKYFFDILHRLLWAMAGLILLLMALSIVMMLLEVRIELNSLRQPLQIAARHTLGREVHLRGNLSLVPSLWPTLEVRNVQIANPSGWKKGVFADAQLLRIQLGLMSLLQKKFQVSEISAEGIAINLQSNLHGEPNWYFSKADTIVQNNQEVETQISFRGVDELILKKVAVKYRDQQLQRSLHVHLDELEGEFPKYGPFKLKFNGEYGERPYELDLTAGNTYDFFDQSKTWPVQISARIAGMAINAEGNKTKGNDPELKAQFKIDDMNAGAVLEWFEVAKGVEAMIGSVTADAVLRGNSLYALLERSEFLLTFKDARWILSDTNSGSKLPITIKQGTLTANPQASLSLALESSINQIPVAISIQGAKLIDYGRPGVKLPVVFDLQGAETQLTLQSSIIHPIEAYNLDFKVRMKGDRLNRLNHMLQLDLPPLGPYSLSGGFSANSGGYRVHDLAVNVGNSKLHGYLDLETKQRPPRLNVQLESWWIQLDDFALHDWLFADEIDLPQGNTGAQMVQQIDTQADGPLLTLLNPDVLNSLDAKISIKVNQIFSGEDSLGRGELLLGLEKGKLDLNPLKVDIPGGNIWLHWQFFPTENDAEIALQAKVDKFDYGILARRIDSQSRVSGKLSLDVDLQAQKTDLNRLLVDSNGHFDFGVWPKSANARIFNLWPANMLSAVVSNVDRQGESKINCAIAGFRLENGNVHEKVMFVDTSRMTISGNAKVNFKSKTVQAYFQPESKSPESSSQLTPVKVEGHFKDFDKSINPKHMVGSVISFVSSPVHTPMQRLFTETPLAVDGKKACEAAWLMRGNSELSR